MKSILSIVTLAVLFSCSTSDDAPASQSMYFPGESNDIWETTSPANHNWNEVALEELFDYLEQKNTRGFIILINGRIVVEKYLNGHTASSPWYWASAGKTLTAATTGIAEQEGLLSIEKKVSDYLGKGWTGAPQEKENLITIRHLLTMTSGLDDTRGDGVTASNLHYVADAGTRWAYHNVYVKLQDVVAVASEQSWNGYFDKKLKDPISMTGAWIKNNDLNVYWSNTRSMARFGLLMQNLGKWKDQQIINSDYCRKATGTSQNLNQAYGFLWWINGPHGYQLPQSQFQFSGSLIPSAPTDMYMALGRDDQKIYIVPSRGMVVIRTGEAADNLNPALSDFDDALWQKIMNVIK